MTLNVTSLDWYICVGNKVQATVLLRPRYVYNAAFLKSNFHCNMGKVIPSTKLSQIPKTS